MSDLLVLVFLAFAVPCAFVTGIAAPLMLFDWLSKKLR